MLEFICPECGKRVEGDDTFSSSPAHCSTCNRTMNVIGNSPVRQQGLPWMRWLPAIFAVVIVGTLISLVITAVMKAREAAARTQSTNNLKNIGLAFHGFHDTHKRLPFNGTAQAKKGDVTSGSWGFQILDFVLESRPDSGRMIFMCPGRGRPNESTTGGWTDYFINPWVNDPDGVVDAPDIKRRLVDIADGSSVTIMVGHGCINPDMYSSNVSFPQSTDILKGGAPGTARRSTTNQRDRSGEDELHWGSSFSKGSVFCYCDATTRLLPYTVTGGEIANGKSDMKSNHLGRHLTPAGEDTPHPYWPIPDD